MFMTYSQQPPAYPPTTPTYQPAPQAPKSGNGLGLASLIVGIVAFIGAFVPFINYVSGVIAVIGLVLGVIALFLKNKTKGVAIAGAAVSFVALILSIALAIAYTSAFVVAVDDALPYVDSVTTEAAQPPSESGEVAPVESNPAFGTTFTYEDGMAITVGEPVSVVVSDSAAGADQANNVVFSVTITNGTAENFEPVAFSSVTSGGVPASSIFDSAANIGGFPPTTTIPAGQSVTWDEAYSIADLNQIVFEVSPSFFYENAVFQK